MDRSQSEDAQTTNEEQCADALDATEGGQTAPELAELSETIDADTEEGADDIAQSPQEPDPETRGEDLEQVTSAIGELISEVHQLAELVCARSRTEQTMREMATQLHTEMRAYKDSFLQKALEPMFRSLISLADNMDTELAQGGGEARAVCVLREELLEVLSRYGVEEFSSTDATTFDPRTQKALKTEPTDDEKLHRSIVERHHPGYRNDDGIIRPELVTICVCKPTQSSKAEREQDE